MALYWPNEKVALDIVDDPHRRPFNGGDDWTVLNVHVHDLTNHESYTRMMGELCRLLGREVPAPPEPKAQESDHEPYAIDDTIMCGMSYFADLSSVLPNPVQIIARDQEGLEQMRASMSSMGLAVSESKLWNGPVPPGSFEPIAYGTRMSTPQFFFLRMANKLPLPEAVRLGIELCGKYRTNITEYDAEDDAYDFLRETRTTTSELRRYLRQVQDSREGTKASRVLSRVLDRCSSPAGCFLYLMLCLPTSQGGYGLMRPELAGVFFGDEGFVPSAKGPYLAYDLVWHDKLVAAQYTGKSLPDEETLAALECEGMRVVCFTDEDLADAIRFDAKARDLAHLLALPVADANDLWLKRRALLRRRIEVPTYPHMMLTSRDIETHLESERDACPEDFADRGQRTAASSQA